MNKEKLNLKNYNADFKKWNTHQINTLDDFSEIVNIKLSEGRESKCQ